MLVVLVVAFELVAIAFWAWYFFFRAPYRYTSSPVVAEDSYEARQYSIQRSCGSGINMKM